MKVLSLSGGGYRGVITAKFLERLETFLGKPLSEVFDLIVGTSTGGIIACALSSKKLNLSARDILLLYETRGEEIFYRSKFYKLKSLDGYLLPKYETEKGLQKVMYEYFGDEKFDNLRTKTLVTAYDMASCSPKFFKSWKDNDRTIAECAIATASAPTYFAPYSRDNVECLVDGGVANNNPNVVAIAEILKTETLPKENHILVHIGTGKHEIGIGYNNAKKIGSLGWIKSQSTTPLLNAMFDAQSDTAEHLALQLFGNNCYSFNATIPKEISAMDKAGFEQFLSLRNVALNMIDENMLKISELCQKLLK